MLLLQRPIYLWLLLATAMIAAEQQHSFKENANSEQNVAHLKVLPYVLQKPQLGQETQDYKRYSLQATKSDTVAGIENEAPLLRQHSLEEMLQKTESDASIWDPALLSPYNALGSWKYVNIPPGHSHASITDVRLPVTYDNLMPTCNGITPGTAMLTPPILMLMLNLGLLLYGLLGILGLMQQLPLAFGMSAANNLANKQLLERKV